MASKKIISELKQYIDYYVNNMEKAVYERLENEKEELNKLHE